MRDWCPEQENYGNCVPVFRASRLPRVVGRRRAVLAKIGSVAKSGGVITGDIVTRGVQRVLLVVFSRLFAEMVSGTDCEIVGEDLRKLEAWQ